MPDSRVKTDTKFKKGQSGNPGGRKKLPQEFQKLAKEKSYDALKILCEIMENSNAKTDVRVKCAELIMAYGVGKPSQVIDMTGGSGIKVIVAYE